MSLSFDIIWFDESPLKKKQRRSQHFREAHEYQVKQRVHFLTDAKGQTLMMQQRRLMNVIVRN
jgi:hypothetical protein